MDEIWEQVLGQIPEAPGLEDLDELYPEDRIKPQPDDGLMPLPPLPGMPPLPLPLPVPEALPVADLEVSSEISVPAAEVASEGSPKRKGTAKWILLALVIAGAAYYWSEFGSPI